MTSIESLEPALNDFMARERLPSTYRDTVNTWFLPLAHDLLHKVAHSRQAPVIGVSGCQGSGKSTLAALLVLLLRELMGLRCVNLSIDDFYLSRNEREALGERVHPLLRTRGVPGTHDVALALATLRALREPGTVPIPRFDKGVDDRRAIADWPPIAAPVDVIVLEGWCLCIGPQDDAALAAPINTLEAEEDTTGAWRRYVNAQLRGPYVDFYAMVDYLVMLKAPDFEQVYRWRQRQEDKLAASVSGEAASAVMSPAALRRFIQHYERLTRHGLATLPAQADVVFELGTEQNIVACSKR
ncbi:MAG TPA: hypothetical protein VNR18_14435 [Hyphomicrobiales bacterium]|nr:hypothetical protein [Hyphomicrobiales bacterium]